MREILFRGKALSSGMWVCGGHVKGPEISGGHSYIVRYHTGGVNWHRVDPATVGQYTGLTDKNGKRIFEGDVFSYGFEEVAAIGVVRFGEYSFGSHFDMNNVGFYVEWHPRAMYYRNDLGFWMKQRQADIEFIGNIHDNPELLKG